MTGTLDFEAINARALPILASLAREWLPDGRLRGVEWIARNPHRADKRIGSLSVNCRSGVWRDFPTDDGGSDPISLYAFARSCRQIEAARALADMLGVETGGSWEPSPGPIRRPYRRHGRRHQNLHRTTPHCGYGIGLAQLPGRWAKPICSIGPSP